MESRLRRKRRVRKKSRVSCAQVGCMNPIPDALSLNFHHTHRARGHLSLPHHWKHAPLRGEAAWACGVAFVFLDGTRKLRLCRLGDSSSCLRTSASVLVRREFVIGSSSAAPLAGDSSVGAGKLGASQLPTRAHLWKRQCHDPPSASKCPRVPPLSGFASA